MAKALRAELVERLLAGQDGAEVVQLMRDHPSAFTTNSSLQSYISQIKRAVLDSGDPRAVHPQYKATLAALRRRAGKPDVDPACRAKALEFAGASLRVQYHTHRAHARLKFCWGHPAVDAALRAVQVLPDNLATFRSSAEEASECRRAGAAATLLRNQSVLVVKDASTYLDRAVEILRGCGEQTTLGALGFALLLVSGRRTAEVFNMQSTFARGPTRYSAVFTGQLKVKGRAVPGYAIPLLCPFSTFAAGMRVLRDRQAPNPPRDSAHVNTRYGALLSRAVQNKYFVPEGTVHSLRRFYAQAVWIAFGYEETPVTFNAMTKSFLGHAELAQSLAYNDLRLIGLKHRFKGRLPVGE